MAKIEEVYAMIKAGHCAQAVMDHFKMPPSKLRRIMNSRRIRESVELSRELTAVTMTLHLAAAVASIPGQLMIMAFQDKEPSTSIRAAQTLLKYIDAWNDKPAQRKIKALDREAGGQEAKTVDRKPKTVVREPETDDRVPAAENPSPLTPEGGPQGMRAMDLVTVHLIPETADQTCKDAVEAVQNPPEPVTDCQKLSDLGSFGQAKADTGNECKFQSCSDLILPGEGSFAAGRCREKPVLALSAAAS